MITLDYFRLSHPDAPMAASYGRKAMCEEWRDRDSLRRPAESYRIEPVPYCGCCGESHGPTTTWEDGVTRCAKHHERNPCAIEGCTRSTAAPESGRLADDSWLCSTHWRRYCPPRSRRRRAYHAFWRQAKRQGGWDSALVDRFHRFWDQLIASARARSTAGTLDEAAIAKLFGWDDL